MAFRSGQFKFGALQLVARYGVAYAVLFRLEHGEAWVVPDVTSTGVPRYAHTQVCYAVGESRRAVEDA